MPDIAAGTIFTNVPPGNAVDASRLNLAFSGQTILPAFISGKSLGTPTSADRIVTLNAGALIAPTLATLLDFQLKDAAAATASMRTLGVGAQQAAPGNLTPRLNTSNVNTGLNNKFAHIGGTTSGTCVVEAGAGGGSAAAARQGGSGDIAGIINLTTGTTPTANSAQCTINFGVAYAVAPFILLVPYNANALAAQRGTAGVFVGGGTAAWTIQSNTVALPANTLHVYAYIIVATGAE